MEEIRSIAEQSRPDLDSYLNCNPINPHIHSELTNQGIEAKQIIGSISTQGFLIGSEEHMFLEISKKEIKSNLNGSLIVDGALDQFCQSAYDNGRVSQNLGPRENIPCPAVLRPIDNLYDVYHHSSR